ncbi:MAG: cytochrome c biogenesis protein ResB, partial [Candidatus Magasanikbacteria bacterium]|nr:cytochrome c biogenesis protein ResB [Candidatus Magasanikbacteria bacterium]
PALFASKGNKAFNEKYKIGDALVTVKVKSIIPNPKQTVSPAANGKPTIKIVLAGSGGREEYFVKEGESKNINGLDFNFSTNVVSGAFNILRRGDSLFFSSQNTFTQMTMATQQLDTLRPSSTPHPLKLRSLYSDGENRFVFGDYFIGGDLKIISEKMKMSSESTVGLLLEVSINGKISEQYVYGQKGVQGLPVTFQEGNTKMEISYGAKPIVVPFKIKLKDFIMDRYPGTNSAASYASEVQLTDDNNGKKMDYRIFMNNILDYGGYRFFQSSFDQDERGTYLSVNHDFWGTWITYIGYIMLTLGFALTLVSKKTRFYQLSQRLKQIRLSRALSIFFIFSLISTTSFGIEEVKPDKIVVSEDHAALFSKVVVQDVNGRMKPMHTLDRELLRKISGSESFDGLNADQVILSMFAANHDWYTIKIIKLGSQTKKLLNTDQKLASYKDFFDEQGNYKILEAVKKAYDSKPVDRGTLEKELIKVDERVNIVGMIFSGSAFKIIPIPKDPNNTWTAGEMMSSDPSELSPANQLANNFFSQYQSVLNEAIKSKDYSAPNKLLTELSAFQLSISGAVMPSASKMQAEIFLNNLDIFGKLSLAYTFLGLFFL